VDHGAIRSPVRTKPLSKAIAFIPNSTFTWPSEPARRR
jgi:hypothetical protein